MNKRKHYDALLNIFSLPAYLVAVQAAYGTKGDIKYQCCAKVVEVLPVVKKVRPPRKHAVGRLSGGMNKHTAALLPRIQEMAKTMGRNEIYRKTGVRVQTLKRLLGPVR